MPEPTATPPAEVDYRMAPLLAARFVGSALVALALVMLLATVLVAALELNADLLVVLLVVGLAAVFWLGWYLRSRAYVVRFAAEGYRIRFVRGAGVREARWTDVEEAVTSTPRGIPCLVLKLGAKGSSTVPVEALAVDREQFVRDLQARLQHGHGLRSL